MADAAAIAAWQRIMSLVYIVLLSTVILILFSDIFGVADRVVVALNGGRTIRSSLGGIGALIFCLMYVFDFSYWPGTLGKICRRIGVLLVLCFVVATAVVSQAAFAWAPLAVSIMLLPFLLVFMITTVFGSVKQNLPGVASWLGVALLLTSAYVVVLWALWFSGALHGEAVQYWGSQKAVFAAAAQCNRRDEDTGRFTHSGVTTLADGTVVCLAAMILWASPLILAAVLFFLGLFTLLLGRSLRQSSGSASLLKLTAAVLFTCFIGIYAAGGVGGASVGVSTAALAIFCVLLVSTVVLVGAVIGFDSLQTRVSSHPVMLKLHDAVSGPFLEWVQALFAFFGVVPFCAFLALSFVNQLVRKADREATCVQFAKDIQNEKTGHLTTLANRQLAYMATWSWTAVLGKAQIIGYLVWGSYYGVTLTYIVLNFVISALISVHWAAVSAIFFATGLIMFLIPVVPGTAVYLTGGVLLVPVCEAAWSGCNAGGACAVANATLVNGSASVTSVVADCSTTSGGTFWLAIIWAGFLTYVLKFIAHVCQHKWFGEGCGRSVAVRAAVGPNSTIMKSIRLILEAKGVTPAKACIMCGGPDWPTSVICGMLRIPLAGSSLGLVPIFIFTFPVVIAGAFQTKTVEPYSNLFPLALLFVMVLNLVFSAPSLRLTARPLALFIIHDVRVDPSQPSASCTIRIR